MAGFRIDYQNVLPFVNQEVISGLKDKLFSAQRELEEKRGRGSEFTGWINLPSRTGNEELDKIDGLAAEIRTEAEVLVSIGIGGSYLGAKAVISAFEDKPGVEVLFAGKNISGIEHERLLAYLEDKDFFINVISKSGTTTEPAIAFRLIKELAKKKYGKNFNRRIIATTDSAKGALRRMSEEEGFRTFVIPDDVGGRFSVLTPVGLLPVACAGIDIQSLMAGATEAEQYARSENLEQNPALLYAAIRYLLYRSGKKVELLSSFDPRLFYLVEWWKQLFGESEGKNSSGIFPAGCVFSTDLHSLGQYIQEGERMLFETFMLIEKTSSIAVTREKSDLDGLNYLAGRTLDEINCKAYEGTRKAHFDGGVPNLSLMIPELTTKVFGELLYFFEKAVAVSGYLLEVNPFDQPGVEAYKKNMFRLLEKPGN
ncbi:MAG: glucose-6-phosphate isomerase [Candidatus Wallbacteria bacterium]|nr:glucose-6-phosphate isomerase [Candidatus Wallbacteria bacterium]